MQMMKDFSVYGKIGIDGYEKLFGRYRERAERVNEKYQLYYYWNHGMCDQCGAPILILNEALSYEGNDQQELQAFWMSTQSAGIFLIKMNRKILKKLAAVKSWKKHIITNRHIGPCAL